MKQNRFAMKHFYQINTHFPYLKLLDLESKIFQYTFYVPIPRFRDPFQATARGWNVFIYFESMISPTKRKCFLALSSNNLSDCFESLSLATLPSFRALCHNVLVLFFFMFAFLSLFPKILSSCFFSLKKKEQ